MIVGPERFATIIEDIAYKVLWVFIWGRSSTPTFLYRAIILEQFLLTLSISTRKHGVGRSFMEAGNASDAISVEKIQNQSCHRNKCEKIYCTNRKLISVSYTHGVTILDI